MHRMKTLPTNPENDSLRGASWPILDGTDPLSWPRYCQRPVRDIRTETAQAQAVFDRLSAEGVPALLAYAQQWDGVRPEPLLVSDSRRDALADQVDADLAAAIDDAASRIEAYHKTLLLADSKPLETAPGVRCWQRWQPLDSVGLYAPGGATPLISTVLMTALPARLAGCPTRVLCVAPGADGWPAPAMCYAARRAGVTHFARVGGMQAIAAMALGVGLPAVRKLFGPGSARVDAAKALAVSYGVARDLPAGPSEVLVLGDATMPAAWAAADLLAQAEHGADSQVLAVSDDAAWLSAVADALSIQLATLPRRSIAARSLEAARFVQVADRDAGMAFSNAYAPEHLMLATADAAALLPGIRNAGSVFVGRYSPEAAGDYATGSNHTLPTGGAAAAWSGLSVTDFMRRTNVQVMDKEGLAGLANTVSRLARAEGLEGHARSVWCRLNSKQAKPWDSPASPTNIETGATPPQITAP
jgi:histidinol dehydrogenase